MRTKKHQNKSLTILLVVTILVNAVCIFGWKAYYGWLYFHHPERLWATPEWYISEFQKSPSLSIVENMYHWGVALPYAIILADYYDQPDANYYVFASLQKAFLDSEKEIPDSTFEAIALPYLERGAEKGSELCIKQLLYLYNDEQFVTHDTMPWKHYKFLYDSIQARHSRDSLQRSDRGNRIITPKDSVQLAAEAKEVAAKLLHVIDSMNSL